MKKLYSIVMGILYTIIGILIVSCLIILFFDKLDFLHPSNEEDEKSVNNNDYKEEIFIGDDDYNTLTFPISAVKAMDLVDRFANPYANIRYEYGEIRVVDGKEYHAIFSSGGRPRMVELETGEIFVYYEEEGLKALKDVIPLFIDHRSYIGAEEYKEGYEFFHYYMRFVIDKCDEKAAISLMDTSYFEDGVPAEKKEHFERIVKITEACQKAILSLGSIVEQQVLADDYEIGYVVSSVDEYEDDTGAKWIDIYIDLTCYYEKNGYIDTAGEHYRISVREYSTGWKVARISES